MRKTITIAAGGLRAEIVPSLGGGLAHLDMLGDRSPVPIFRPWPEGGTDDPNRLASYVLVPWSNRISGRGFRFEGRFHPLEPNFPGEPFPLHGNGWTSEWAVSGRTTELVSLAFVSDGPGSFRYSAALGYEIDATSLTMRLNVTTRADHPLPYGLGFHPWLIRTARTRLEAPAAGVWLEDKCHLPIGSAPVSSREDWDFTFMQPLPDGWINNGFGGWNRRASVEWLEYGMALDIEASDALSTYLLYSPGAEAEFFCFEPVSHLVDAHNLPGGPNANGLQILRCGESFEITCRFALRRL